MYIYIYKYGLYVMHVWLCIGFFVLLYMQVLAYVSHLTFNIL